MGAGGRDEAVVEPGGVYVGLPADLRRWVKKEGAEATTRAVQRWLEDGCPPLPRVPARRGKEGPTHVGMEAETHLRLEKACEDRGLLRAVVVRSLIAEQARGKAAVQREALKMAVPRERRRAGSGGRSPARAQPVAVLSVVMLPGTKTALRSRLQDLSVGVVVRLMLEAWLRAGAPPVRGWTFGEGNPPGSWRASVKVPEMLSVKVRSVSELRGQSLTVVMRALLHGFAAAEKPSASVVRLMAEGLRASVPGWKGGYEAAEKCFDGVKIEVPSRLDGEKMTAKMYLESLQLWAKTSARLDLDRAQPPLDPRPIALKVPAAMLDAMLGYLRDPRGNTRSLDELVVAVARSV